MGDDISEKYRSDHSKNSYSKKALDFTYIGLANCMGGLPGLRSGITRQDLSTQQLGSNNGHSVRKPNFKLSI